MRLELAETEYRCDRTKPFMTAVVGASANLQRAMYKGQ